MADFIDIDSVLKELNISETDLTKLISEGEIIAFKDEISQKLRFLSTDVSKLKEELKGKLYITLDEVEKLSNLSKNQIMDMVSEGKLQAFKDIKEPSIVKFKKSDVLKFVKKNGNSHTLEKKEKLIDNQKEQKAILEQKRKQELKSAPDLKKQSPITAKVSEQKEQKKTDMKTATVQSNQTQISDTGDMKSSETKEEDDLFLELKEEKTPKTDDSLELNIESIEKEKPEFENESISTEETDVDLGKLFDESETKIKEGMEQETEEQEESVLLKKKPISKSQITPFEEVGYEENTADMIILLLTLAILILIGVFVYDSFHVLEANKIIKPSDFTKQIGQQVASTLGAKDINLEQSLAEEKMDRKFKVGGKK